MENSKISKEALERIVLIAFVTISVSLLVWMIIDDLYKRNEVYRIINNPTFVGKVVNKDFIQHEGSRFTWPIMTMGYTEYRLHIVGEYLSSNEIVQLNRIVSVRRYLYDLFEIGDSINQ